MAEKTVKPVVRAVALSPATQSVDLAGRLTNPSHNFGRAAGLLATVLGRPEPSRLPEQAGLQPQHRLLPWETEALVEAYNEGFSIEQLARQFCLHRTTVVAQLEREGAPRRATGPKLDPAATLRAASLYLGGLSLKDVAREFEVNPTTIGNTLKRAGIPLRQRRGWPRVSG